MNQQDIEKIMTLADEYANCSACEVDGFNAAKDNETTQEARDALLRYVNQFVSYTPSG